MFALGDRVRVAAHLGGRAGEWEGFVRQLVGGPDDRLYRVQGRHEDPDRAPRTVAESDIVAGPLAAPVFSVGRSVSIDGFAGTVTADNGDGTYDVEVTWWPNEHMTLIRRHVVPGWQLAIWSAEG